MYLYMDTCLYLYTQICVHTVHTYTHVFYIYFICILYIFLHIFLYIFYIYIYIYFLYILHIYFIGILYIFYMYFTYILHVFYVCVWTSIHQARRCVLVTQIYDDDLEKEIVAAALQRCIYCSWLKSNVDLI